MKTHRQARIAEAIREVSADLQHTKIFVSVMGSEKEQKLTLRGLKHAAGFIQSKLAKRLQTRFTPVITFVLDQGVKTSIEITRLITEAHGKAPAAAAHAGEESVEDDGESTDDDEESGEGEEAPPHGA